MNYQALREMLIIDEGLKFHPYTDTEGKLTIGVGRNLTDIGITKDEAMFLLDNDIKAAVTALDGLFNWWRGMSEVRQQVMVNLCFNLGISTLSGFKLFLAAAERGDYEEAANQLINSHWYTQVGGRGIRLVSLMRNGK